MLIGNHWWQIDPCRFWLPWVTRNPGFKVTVWLQVEYLKNGASYGQSYYRTLIGNHKQSIEWYPFRWHWVNSDPDFKVMTFLTTNISETTRDRATVTIECQYEVIYDLSNGDMPNHLDGPITRISRSHRFWSRISRKRCVLGTKLLENTNRKS